MTRDFFVRLEPERPVKNNYLRCCKRCDRLFRVSCSLRPGSRIVCPDCNENDGFYGFDFLGFITDDDYADEKVAAEEVSQ